MRTVDLIKNARSVDECVESIKLNDSHSYQWFACKGVKGCLFEIGGRNMNGLELKLYIPVYDENGKPVSLSNGFVRSEFSIDISGIQFPTCNVHSKEDIDIIKLAKTKDFRKFKPKYELYERCYQMQTEKVGTLISL